MMNRRILQLLKLIGIAIFLWILIRIDRKELIEQVKGANLPLLLSSYIIIYIIYAAKTLRWHMLVKNAGLNPTFSQSWHLYNIGVFLALVTPAKLGELGRAAYLRNSGMHGATAVSIVILDRLADVSGIGIIAIVSAGILFGWIWSLVVLVVALSGLLILILLRKKLSSVCTSLTWLTFLPKLLKPKTLFFISITTLISWAIYFTWALLIARSIGVNTAIPILVSVFTITGILALIPIAPSGLGTRDAALVALLAPYGILAEQAVAQALLMFTIIILSGALGMWYWLVKPVEMRKN
ncbi:MAG: lysylphosphatidylglycerol synthase transmembrane domain-containing protein [Patescibacteria group bacterium]